MFEGLTNINEIITFLRSRGIVQVLFIFNFFYSIFYGTKHQRTHGDLQLLNGQPNRKNSWKLVGEIPTVRRWAMTIQSWT